MISLAVVAAFALAHSTSGADEGRSPGRMACEGAQVDPWVTQLRDRFLRFDELAHFAIETHGSPSSCDGSVTTEFDGAKFGVVLLTFEGGITLEVETMPPGVSRVTLRSPTGFDDEDSVRVALVSYALGTGLQIDWEVPTTATDGGERIESYWDPTPGLNASAALIFSEDALVAVRLGMAP